MKKQLTEIAQDWINIVNPSEPIREKIMSNIEICTPCENNMYDSEKRQYLCTACGCGIGSKVITARTDVKCPINKF
jgi:hydrogenase maturation factor HypF (carbamoyltransferase family)